mmetsp:Transcript_39451/g.92781  ORF Transcript_39451/g.92781 Transcript_39451/m.92781 type:complete len:208 (-) Transcript_39451:83-706(-)
MARLPAEYGRATRAPRRASRCSPTCRRASASTVRQPRLPVAARLSAPRRRSPAAIFTPRRGPTRRPSSSSRGATAWDPSCTMPDRRLAGGGRACSSARTRSATMWTRAYPPTPRGARTRPRASTACMPRWPCARRWTCMASARPGSTTSRRRARSTTVRNICIAPSTPTSSRSRCASPGACGCGGSIGGRERAQCLPAFVSPIYIGA